MSSPKSCPVCTEKFLRTPNRKALACHLCEYTACSGCCQTYLLGSVQNAHCMNCRREWSKEFMIQSFSGTFMNQTYKKHRENILMARQKSLLPLRVVKVERIVRGEEMKTVIEQQVAILLKKRKELAELEREHLALYSKQQALLVGNEPGVGVGINEKKNRVVEFHKPCPADTCRGFLSTQYKCGVCSTWVCPDCYEIKGLVKDTEHTCNPENVASVKLKKAQCKNCPDCGAEIYKESGCAQMWCTQCRTTFDWATGAKLVDVKVHNPHYYEYMRRTKGSVPRDVDDRQGVIACYNHTQVYMSIVRIGQRALWDTNTRMLLNHGLCEAMRVIAHIDDVELARHLGYVDENTNEDIDIAYLRKKIDEETWKQSLQNREKQRIKKQDILQILQMVSQAGKDIILAFTNRYILEVYEKDTPSMRMNVVITDTWKQLEGIRTLANESFEKHARLYKCQAPIICLENAPKATPHQKEGLYVWTFKLKYNYIAAKTTPAATAV